MNANIQVAVTVTVAHQIQALAIRDGKVAISVYNPKTDKLDRFQLSVDEQGSTYHLLLSQEVADEQKPGAVRMKGIHAVRNLIDNIGDYDA